MLGAPRGLPYRSRSVFWHPHVQDTMSFNLASLFALTMHINPRSKCVRGCFKAQKLRATLYNTGVHMQTLWEI